MACDTGPTRKSGVLICIKHGFTQQIKLVVQNDDGRYIILVAIINGQTFIISGFYGEANCSDRVSLEVMTAFGNDLDEVSANYPTNNILIGGDFNCTLKNGDAIYKVSKKQTENKLKQILNTHNLIDLWEEIYPDKSGFTFGTVLSTDGNEVIQQNASRIDRFYVTESSLSHPLIYRENGIRVSADHLSLHAELKTILASPPPI